MYAEHVYDPSLPTPSQMRWVADATNPDADAVPLPAVSPGPVRSLRSVDMPTNLTVTEIQRKRSSKAVALVVDERDGSVYRMGAAFAAAGR